METETLTAGRALDRRVCEALGIRAAPDAARRYPPVSTDPGAAWRLLVPAMQARGYSYGVWGVGGTSSVSNCAAAAFTRGVYPPQYGYADPGTFWGCSEPGDTNPALALCRACLAALSAVAGRGEGESATDTLVPRSST